MSAAAVIHRLCDVVAKNGNLLLRRFRMRGDGTIDSDERAIVEAVATWMQRFGERDLSGRGRGACSARDRRMSPAASSAKKRPSPSRAEDIRFTTLGEDLNAMTLGRASGTVTIRSLSEGTNLGQGQVQHVELVGSPGALDFTRDSNGLHVQVPESASHEFGVALKIKGQGLV